MRSLVLIVLLVGLAMWGIAVYNGNGMATLTALLHGQKPPSTGAINAG